MALQVTASQKNKFCILKWWCKFSYPEIQQKLLPNWANVLVSCSESYLVQLRCKREASWFGFSLISQGIYILKYNNSADTRVVVEWKEDRWTPTWCKKTSKRFLKRNTCSTQPFFGINPAQNGRVRSLQQEPKQNCCPPPLSSHTRPRLGFIRAQIKQINCVFHIWWSPSSRKEPQIPQPSSSSIPLWSIGWPYDAYPD